MSLRGLGVYTKSGSSFLVMAIIGGAVFTAAMGCISRESTINVAYLVPAVCFAIVFLFAWKSAAGPGAGCCMTLARRELGNTGLEVSELGFGGAAIGNLYRELADEDASAAVRESFAAGVRYFDTAPFYGFGLSEVRLGQALQGAQALPVISTKVGRRLVPTGPQDASVGREGYFSPRPFAPVFDYGYESVMRSHAESLERLKVARIDILLCHDIGRMTHGAAHAARVAEFVGGGYRAMRELRDAGTVRAIGLGVNEWEICVELLAELRVRLHPAGRPLHAARTARAGNAAAAVRATPRVHHLRRAVQLRHSRGRLSRRREGALQLRRATARGTRTRDPARTALRGVLRAAASRGAAVPAGASAESPA